MGTMMQILLILLPIVFTGAVAVYVVKGVAGKKGQGAPAKEQSKEGPDFLASYIPVGFILGSAAGLIFSFFFPFPWLNLPIIGAGMGMLVGYFAYEHSSRDEESNP